MGKVLRTDELLAAYARGERGFAGADLTDANLRYAYLTGATLAYANLRGADLRVADLRVADLRVANLAGADLTDANLTRADLTDANLTLAYLTDANLAGADLTGADLAWADLRGADLTGAYLAGADLRGADLTGATINPASHDLLAELLLRAAGNDMRHREMAGIVLISRDWCWSEFASVARDHWTAEERAWVAKTLAPWPNLASHLRHAGFVASVEG